MTKIAIDTMEKRVKQIRSDANRLNEEALVAEREADRLKGNAASKPNIRSQETPRKPLQSLAQMRREANAAASGSNQSGWGYRKTRKARKRGHARGK